jgi:hydroxymethylpyrimidine pyrophosphatase-like HAD family hydrolase
VEIAFSTARYVLTVEKWLSPLMSIVSDVIISLNGAYTYTLPEREILYSAAIPRKLEVTAMSYSKTQIREILNNWDIDVNATIGNVPIMAGAKISDSVWSIGNNYYLIAANGDDEISKQLKDTATVKALAKQGFNSALPVPTTAGDET